LWVNFIIKPFFSFFRGRKNDELKTFFDNLRVLLDGRLYEERNRVVGGKIVWFGAFIRQILRVFDKQTPSDGAGD